MPSTRKLGQDRTPLRFDKLGLQQTELRQTGIPLTSATTSASSSVPATTTSKLFLDAQPSATDEPMPAATDQSGGIKRPTEASSEMRTGVGDVGTDVPTNVLCPISEEVEDHEGQEEDSKNEMHLVPERWVYDSKTGIEISRERYWRVARLTWK